MNNILHDISSLHLVKPLIKANWENYHYCLGTAPNVELAIGRYLTWLITNMPDHFMNLVVCTELPEDGIDELIEDALEHFKLLNIKRLSWLAEAGVPAHKIRKHLLAHGLTFNESFAVEMAVDMQNMSEGPPRPNGLEIVLVDDQRLLRQWIHVASVGFGVPVEMEEVWFEFFHYAVHDSRFQTYLALLNGKPVGTSQLFGSAGVAGIYNVTCIPEARGQGVGTAVVRRPLLDACKLGYKVGILQASAMGYKVYRKLGFRDFGKLSVYLWEQEATP
jgi:GNAT superfamily N-acetyltransferase